MSESKVKPIPFSLPMVRAIIEDRKIMTRRVLKPQPTGVNRIGIRWPDGVLDCDGQRLHFRPGDLLWVRETWSGDYWLKDAPPSERLQICAQVAHVPKTPRTWYWADGDPDYGDWEKPRPSIHMPRWASRLTLEVTAVKVERLQEISEEDAIAEGINCDESLPTDTHRCWLDLGNDSRGAEWLTSWDARDVFRQLWHVINGPGAWEANPWVAAYSFRVYRVNVDGLLRSREAA